ncbi:orotidine-5'-phosphate decarboxylase [bacterium]|nr:orotidine-5'-phosphate decarboxylase [bacterium]
MNPVITALDVSDRETMRSLIKQLAPFGGIFKLGLEMFVGFGPEIVRELIAGGGKVMLDLKLHDIPNTVRKAAKNAGTLGAELLTVHASGGSAMLKAAVEGVKEAGSRTKVLAVTVLTSIDEETLQNELGVGKSVIEQVKSLALLARESGVDGVVCSPKEIKAIRECCGPDFLIVTPGIRPKGSAVGDQKRIKTPSEAINDGASYIVVGRPITEAASPASAMQDILNEIENAK